MYLSSPRQPISSNEKERDARINISSGRERGWVTPNILCVRRLVHPYIVDHHRRRELNVGKVDPAKVDREPEIGDDVLYVRKTVNVAMCEERTRLPWVLEE